MSDPLPSPEERRRWILERCAPDIRALLEDADEASVPRSNVVVFVIDQREALGEALLKRFAELGAPASGSDVYVLGTNVDFAREALEATAPSMLVDLDELPPDGAAHLICIAESGVSTLFTAVEEPKERARS